MRKEKEERTYSSFSAAMQSLKDRFYKDQPAEEAGQKQKEEDKNVKTKGEAN